jgi:hypothetical protein
MGLFSLRTLFIYMNCKWCNKEFEQKRKDHVYCRKTCRNNASETKTNSRRLSNWKRHGIELSNEEYKLLFVSQGGKCAICGKPQEQLKFALAADHCHTKGKVRGLLCSNCNRGLGFFFESEEILSRAIQYIKRPLPSGRGYDELPNYLDRK